MGVYVEQISGVYEEVNALGGLGRSKRWAKARGFTYGVLATLATQKYIAPGVKNLLDAYQQKRKAARTLKEQSEAEAFRKQLMSAAPELFTQQPGMPSPAAIRQAVESAAPGQPIPIEIVKETTPVRRPIGAEPVRERPVAKPGLAIPPAVTWTLAIGGVAKLFGLI